MPSKITQNVSDTHRHPDNTRTDAITVRELAGVLADPRFQDQLLSDAIGQWRDENGGFPDAYRPRWGDAERERYERDYAEADFNAP